MRPDGQLDKCGYRSPSWELGLKNDHHVNTDLCFDLLRQKVLKVPFFQKVWLVFSNLQKNYSKLLSWAWNLNLLFTVIGGKPKFQVQDSDFWNIIFLEIWKTHRIFWKKATFKRVMEIFVAFFEFLEMMNFNISCV